MINIMIFKANKRIKDIMLNDGKFHNKFFHETAFACLKIFNILSKVETVKIGVRREN